MKRYVFLCLFIVTIIILDAQKVDVTVIFDLIE